MTKHVRILLPVVLALLGGVAELQPGRFGVISRIPRA